MTIEYDKPSNGVTIYKTPKVKIVNGKRRKFYGSIDFLIPKPTKTDKILQEVKDEVLGGKQ